MAAAAPAAPAAVGVRHACSAPQVIVHHLQVGREGEQTHGSPKQQFEYYALLN
jgi:hypothetical protein